jgi:hypothetical protein
LIGLETVSWNISRNAPPFVGNVAIPGCCEGAGIMRASILKCLESRIYNFLGLFFENHWKDFEVSIKFSVSYTHIIFVKKNFLLESN